MTLPVTTGSTLKCDYPGCKESEGDKRIESIGMCICEGLYCAKHWNRHDCSPDTTLPGQAAANSIGIAVLKNKENIPPQHN
jgi:hypothetical protein